MITIEEKLNVFTKMVLGKVQDEYQAKLNELTEKNNILIEQQREELIEKKKKILQEYISKGEIEKEKLISKAKVERKRMILAKKEELIDKLMDNIFKMSDQYTYRKKYEEYIRGVIKRVLQEFKDKNHLNIYVLKRDVERFKELIYNEAKRADFPEDKITIMETKEDIIGGLIAVDGDETVRIDYTLRGLIEENRRIIGQRLVEELEKS